MRFLYVPVLIGIFLTTTTASAKTPSPTPAANSPGPEVPPLAAVETELAALYHKMAVQVLDALLTKQEANVLVQVTVDPSADLTPFKPREPIEEDLLPGVLHRWVNFDEDRRSGDLQALPQQKQVLVVTAGEPEREFKRVASDALKTALRLGEKDRLDFESQADFLADPPGEQFIGSRLFWILVILLTAGLAALALFLYSRRRKSKIKSPGRRNKAGAAKTPQTPEEIKQAEEEAQDLIEAFEPVRKICGIDPEVCSNAFSNLCLRPSQINRAASIVQLIGMDQALLLFPKTKSAVWSVVGDALAPDDTPDPATHEDVLEFRRLLNAEIARVLKIKDQEKLLPNLETKSANEIARFLSGLGSEKTAIALAALPEHLLAGVVQALGQEGTAEALQALSQIRRAKVSDLRELDRPLNGPDGGGEIDLKSDEKIASVLGSMSATEEFETFKRLVSGKESLLRGIAAHRLFPEHVSFLGGDILRQALQSTDFDRIRLLIFAADPNGKAAIISALTDKQKSVIDDLETPDFAEAATAMREFLDRAHVKFFLNQPGAVDKVFGPNRPPAAKSLPAAGRSRSARRASTGELPPPRDPPFRPEPPAEEEPFFPRTPTLKRAV